MKKILERRNQAFGPYLKCLKDNLCKRNPIFTGRSDQTVQASETPFLRGEAIKRFRQAKPHFYGAKRSIGFTLIELLVVIGIIGSLSALLLPNFMSARQRARDTQRKNDLNQVKKALRLYYNDYQRYPNDDGGGKIVGCDTPVTFDWGGEFKCDSTVYMKKLPTDPLGTVEYFYQWVNDDNFLLFADLENKSDPDITSSQAQCGVTGTETQYYVCAD